MQIDENSKRDLNLLPPSLHLRFHNLKIWSSVPRRSCKRGGCWLCPRADGGGVCSKLLCSSGQPLVRRVRALEEVKSLTGQPQRENQGLHCQRLRHRRHPQGKTSGSHQVWTFPMVLTFVFVIELGVALITRHTPRECCCCTEKSNIKLPGGPLGYLLELGRS